MFYLKGYDLSKCSLKKLQKDKFVLSQEIEQQVSRSELTEQMRAVLSDHGIVFFITRKREVKGIVIIGYEKHVASDFTEVIKSEAELMEQTEENKNSGDSTDLGSKVIDKAIEIDKIFYSDKDIEKAKEANAYILRGLYLDETLKEKENTIYEGIIETLKDEATFNDLGVKAFIWNDKIILDKTAGKSSSSAIGIGMCLGMGIGTMIGVLLSSNHGDTSYITMGMLFGLAIGSSFGCAYYGYANKTQADEVVVYNTQKDREGE